MREISHAAAQKSGLGPCCASFGHHAYENLAGELSADFARQLDQVVANMRNALEAAGATVSDVVRIALLVVDHTEASLPPWTDAALRVWADSLAPGCTLISAPRLALHGMLVEVEATAVVAPQS